MKYFIVFLLVLSVPLALHAQITVEHIYQTWHKSTDLIEVDSGIMKYVFFNGFDSIEVYNLDHTQEKIIVLNPIDVPKDVNYSLLNISRRLFDTDDSYEILIIHTHNYYNLRVYKENGSVLYGCDNCTLSNQYVGGFYFPLAIYNTNEGVKMMVDYVIAGEGFQTAVVSLPGKLPGKNITARVPDASMIVTGNPASISAYPNPSTDKIRIDYTMPAGVRSGEIVLSDMNGKEVRKYPVGNTFNDILIEQSDLPGGSYFYRLITPKGESGMKRLVIVR